MAIRDHDAASNGGIVEGQDPAFNAWTSLALKGYSEAFWKKHQYQCLYLKFMFQAIHLQSNEVC